jgi:hypothetical protein
MLTKNLAEAEAAQDDGSLVLPEGMVMKLCPQCNTRIEKSMGCDAMVCWRCG